MYKFTDIVVARCPRLRSRSCRTDLSSLRSSNYDNIDVASIARALEYLFVRRERWTMKENMKTLAERRGQSTRLLRVSNLEERERETDRVRDREGEREFWILEIREKFLPGLWERRR